MHSFSALGTSLLTYRIRPKRKRRVLDKQRGYIFQRGSVPLNDSSAAFLLNAFCLHLHYPQHLAWAPTPQTGLSRTPPSPLLAWPFATFNAAMPLPMNSANAALLTFLRPLWRIFCVSFTSPFSSAHSSNANILQGRCFVLLTTDSGLWVLASNVFI